VKQPAAQSKMVGIVHPAPKKDPFKTHYATRAQYLAAWHRSSALDDPFGDRAVRPAQATEPVEDEKPTTLNAAGKTQEEKQDDPAPPPANGVQPLPQPQPMTMGDPRYNDRDCKAEGDSCRDARMRMEADRLALKTKSVLDITPPLFISHQQRDSSLEMLARIPRREWRARGGRVLATGKLEGIKFRQAQIKDDRKGSASSTWGRRAVLFGQLVECADGVRARGPGVRGTGFRSLDLYVHGVGPLPQAALL
jgi:hypothetical protein